MATSTTKAVVLALDPGTNNYGYSVLEFTLDRMRLRKAGRIHNTLREMNKNLTGQVSSHIDTLNGLMDSFDVTHVVAERYMSRRMGGTTIECVNSMLGIILGLCDARGISAKLIPASQWKNEANRVSEGYLDRMYAEGKIRGITPHTIDATMIALYGRSVLIEKKPFIGLSHTSVPLEINRVGVEDLGVPPPKVRKRRKAKRK